MLVVVVVVFPVLEPSPPPVAASATPTAELTVLVLAAVERPADMPRIDGSVPFQISGLLAVIQALVHRPIATHRWHVVEF